MAIKKMKKFKVAAATALSVLMAMSFGGGSVACAKSQQTESSGAQNVTASSSSASSSRNVKFKEVEGLDSSAIFSENYNRDVVKMNEIAPEENVTAIVNLKVDSLIDRAKEAEMEFSDYVSTPSGEAAKRSIKSKIDSFLTKVRAQGIGVEQGYTYDTVTVGVSVTADGESLNKISEMEGVDSVVVSERYAVPKVIEISNDTNVYSTGIYNTSEVDPELRGDGMVIAVLDTGLDEQHATFQTDNFKAKTYTLTKQKVKELLPDLRATELDVTSSEQTLYKSEKLPYAFDYADKDTNVYPSYSSHGVHVSGIIAGNYTEVPQGIVDSDEDFKFDYDEQKGTHYFEGVVPDAQIVTLKVFTDNIDAEGLGGAETEDILAALEDAVTLNVDVINMSLGTSSGFSSYAEEYMEYVYTRIEEAGISLVCAASNDYSSGFGGVNGTNLTSNPDSATVGSPSTYNAAISVASINGQKDPYMLGNFDGSDGTMIFFTEASDGNSNKMKFVEDLFTRLKEDGRMEADATQVELQYVVIPGLGRSYNYSPQIISKLKSQPSIALVQRGTNSFEEKMKIAKENGAAAVIIYNNVAGTISMTMGLKNKEDLIPSCSISMDTGNELVLNAVGSVGKILIDSSKASGPFMSEFSSWGPTPSLELKPEITAYGGNVTSAVAGGYDVYSGTSMASPNMAGAVAIIRQNLKRQHPDWTANKIHDRAYQIMMSTAGIVLDERANPYSPRKQGAGIADIDASLHTQSYIYVKDKDGNALPKTKIELGDDAQKTGVYKFDFVVSNFSEGFATYNVKPYVLTETVSSDGKTVAERSKVLTESKVTVKVDGVQRSIVGVDGGSEVTVSVEIALSANEKKYLDDNFKNGMFVEGFIALEQISSDTDQLHDLSIPFLAFYGDWTDAPILDYSVFEIADSESDDSIPDDEKLEISFWATQPYAKYGENFILPMGAYLYNMADDAEKIYADEDKAAISRYGDEGTKATTYQFYAVYAGLLRGMGVCDAKIVNEATGEIMWQKTLRNIGKGYANGGSTRPGFVEIEFDPVAMNLPGNTKYHFYMEGYLDYGDGKQGNNNKFDFTFYTDYECPSLVNAAVRYEDYIDAKEEQHTRIWLDLTTYDNMYTQCALMCYVGEDNYLTLMTDYITPIYQDERSSAVTTSIEITDLYEKYYDDFNIQLEDYAMNSTIYNLDLSNGITFPESMSFESETLELTVGQTARPVLNVTPADAQDYDLIWQSANEAVAKVDKGEVYATGVGETYLTVYASNTTTLQVPSARIKVKVSEGSQASAGYKGLSFGVILDGDKIPVNPTNRTVDVNPNDDIQLVTKSEPWYLPQMEVTWTSQNPLVATVDENGLVHTLKEGMSVITARQKDGFFSAYVTLNVGPEFVINNYVLTEYHGKGGDVVVPEELNFMTIQEECFKDNTEITSFIVPEDVTTIEEKAFYGCTALRNVKFPKTLTLVDDSAFEGCTALETIDLTDALSVIFGHRCFYGCSALTEIINDERLTAVWDYTFAGCSSLRELNVTNLVQTGKYSFSNCTSLAKITASKYTSISEGMFFGCTALKTLDLPVEYVGKDAFYACNGLEQVALSGHCVLDEGAFRECSSIKRFYFYGDVYEIGARALEGCQSLKVLILPNNEVTIAENAFARCSQLSTLGVGTDTKFNSPQAFRDCGAWTQVIVAKAVKTASGYNYDIDNSATFGESLKYYTIDGGTLYNKDKSEIVLIPVNATAVEIPATVTKIGSGAFYGLTKLTSITLHEGITEIGDFAFSYSGITEITVPASVTKIGVGTFSYCYSLESVTFAEDSPITDIPEGCFNTTRSLLKLQLPAGVKSIGEYAFGMSGINVLYGGSAEPEQGTFDCSGLALESIATGAFVSSDIVKVILPTTLKTLGSYAFSACPELEEVTFNSNVAMGDYVFFDSTKLGKVTFYDEMESIGNYTFASQGGQRYLSDVHLPENLKEVGAYAFYRCLALETINIPDGVTKINDFAFANSANLTTVNIDKVVSFGDSAFAETGLKEAVLTNAEVIGDYAFYMSKVKSVSVPKVKEIGDGGLGYLLITSLDLPATLEKLGNGAFHYNFYLKGIKIAENDKFFVSPFGTDGYGALYSRLSTGGYQVEAYPGGNSLKFYSVIEGTERIGEMAFTGANSLQEVALPVTLLSIGDKGFYDCAATYYDFTSVNAPTLEARYFEASIYEKGDWNNDLISPADIFSRTGNYSDERFYANFYFYLMFSVYNNIDYGLTITFPVNGIGYNELIYNSYFTSAYMGPETVDNTTLAAINLIKKIDSKVIESLENASADDAEAKQTAEELAATLKEARGYYVNVTSETQKNFLKGGYDRVNYEKILLDSEAKMRPVKDKFGIVTLITKIRVTSQPAKREYVRGEQLDLTGLVVTATYDDGTTAEITDYTIDHNDAYAVGERVRLTVSAQGKTASFYIKVTDSGVVEPETPTTPQPTSGGLAPWAIALISVSAVLVVGGAAAAVTVILIKKKRK